MVDYLRPRLFEPLGIVDPIWEECPRGIDAGGWGLNLRSEQVARFGQLYLQQGGWQGRQLIPAAWVAEATSRQVATDGRPAPDWCQGYGYQFWRCRHHAYRADGAFGQFCVVMPDQDAVLATTNGTTDTPPILDLVWEHLLPAMSAAPLAPDPQGQARLAEKLADLTLPTPRGADGTAAAERATGRRFQLEENGLGQESVQFIFTPNGATLRFAGGASPIWMGCGYGVWMPGQVESLGKVACAGAWADENTYVAQIWLYETPYRITVSSRFEGDRVTIHLLHSLPPTPPMVLTGRLR